MNAQEIAGAVKRFRLPVGSETAYQRAVEQVLRESGVQFFPQYDLGVGYGRIDVFVPGIGLGIELKVKGSPSDVVAQLHRYARSTQIHALMLVTGRALLGARLPDTLYGKPLVVAATWRGGL